MRREVVIVAVAGVAVLFTGATAGAARADRSPHVGPPPAGGGAPPGPVTVQAVATAKTERLAAAQQTTPPGKRLRVDDAATPPSPGTAPAMSASSPLVAVPGGARSATVVQVPGARAPPASVPDVQA